MGEEARVQPPELEVHAAAYDEAGARGPEQLGGLVVLPSVDLHRVQEPPAAEGIAEGVDVAACCARVLEGLGRPQGPDLGLDGA